MALVQFIDTTSAKLDSLSIVEGRFTFTTDTNLLYLDYGGIRVLISAPEYKSSLLVTTNGKKISISGNDAHSASGGVMVINTELDVTVSGEVLVFSL